MVTAEQVLEAFRSRVKKSRRLSTLLKDVDGWSRANDFAKACGRELAQVINDVAADFAGLDAKEVYAILEPSLRENYSEVLRYCRLAQEAVIKNAGLGIKALEPAYSNVISRNAYRVAEDIAGSPEPLTLDRIADLVGHAGMTVVDSSIDANAQAAANMGLECRIVRVYDGVGLHGGKTPCEWCIKRAGTWTDYRSAYDAGAFERHPGCGCRIDYTMSTTRTWSRTAGKWIDR